MKNKMKPIKEHKFKSKAGFTTEHHLKPRSRGGESIGSNLLLLDAYRHSAWHLLFNNMTLDEVISLLIKLKHIKESQRFKYMFR